MKNFRMKVAKIVVVFLLLATGLAKAQISVDGIPESFRLQLKNAAVVPSTLLDSTDFEKFIKEDKDFRIDNRCGVVQQLSVNIKTNGIKSAIPGKGTIWQYRIDSKNALSLGVFFKQFKLPEGGRLFFYNPSKSVVQGAFSEINNNPEEQLPIADFPGKSLIIEYFEPQNVEFSGELVIGSVSQAYLNLDAIAATRIGINCPQGADWQEVKNSVCLMTFNDTKYLYYCTGTLINNVREDGTPYFLTANHCISSDIEAATLVTFFGYENSTCTSSDASKKKTLAGATLKSTNVYTDFTLLLLKEYPPSTYSPYFSGWNANGDLPTSGTGIHHPSGTPKCIAIDKDQVKSYPSSIRWTDEDGNVTSTTVANTHWWVTFDEGNIETGSSGSPLFDKNKRIVGQLHGGGSADSYYGKFSLSWNYSPLSSKQLAYWLDPDKTGVKQMDALGQTAPLAKFVSEVQDVCLNTPVSFVDESRNRPTEWRWKISPSSFQYVDGTDSTSQNPKISFLNEGDYSVTLKASNTYGTSQITQKNYIIAKSALDVAFLKNEKRDSTICGCDLTRFPLIAKGAFLYNFEIREKTKIQTSTSADTLFLTLNPSAIGGNSFDTWVKVTGRHGTCSASDSIQLHIIIQPNDNVENAIPLSLGSHSGYSNRCATTQTAEPSPNTSGCLVENEWCPPTTGSSSVLDNSIWFSFIAPSTGLLTIDTKGFNDQIAVYSADSGSSILSVGKYTLIAANDDRSSTNNSSLIENLELTPGKKYWLQVDGKEGAYGNLSVDLISNSLEVFPNPSGGKFNVIVANPVADMAQVAVYNIQGQKVYDALQSVSTTSNQFVLDLSGFANGVYLLNVKMKGYIHTRKLIIR